MDPCVRKGTVNGTFFVHTTQYFLLNLFISVQQVIVLLPSVKLQLVLIHACDITKDLIVIEIRRKKHHINHFSDYLELLFTVYSSAQAECLSSTKI